MIQIYIMTTDSYNNFDISQSSVEKNQDPEDCVMKNDEQVNDQPTDCDTKENSVSIKYQLMVMVHINSKMIRNIHQRILQES